MICKRDRKLVSLRNNIVSSGRELEVVRGEVELVSLSRDGPVEHQLEVIFLPYQNFDSTSIFSIKSQDVFTDPPLLEPYLALPPEASLILITSVLGASSNWLVLRFLHTALISPDASSEIQGEDEAKVVLVSFMRDLTFWKENAKRLVGLFQL